MANVKISQLPAATTLTGAEVAPIVQAGSTKKAAINLINPILSVKQYGATGDGTTDDTAAIQAAVTAGDMVFFPNGTYKVTSAISIPSNRTLVGEGASSVILYTGTAASQGAFFINSGSSTAYVDNVTVQDLKFLGQVATLGFSEFVHLVSFSGVRNCVIQRCVFEGFRGDGVYIGSGDLAGQERHNINVTVQDCYFDGVNKDNRNGISVIDGTGVTIQNNYFTRTTKSTMPGAIDIEPDSNVYHIIRDISILNNRFFDIGGNVGCIGVLLPGVTYTTAPRGFEITGNYIEDLDGTSGAAGIFFNYALTGGVTESTAMFGIRITNNILRPVDGRGIVIFNATDIVIENNTIVGGVTSLLGYTPTDYNVLYCTLKNNTFSEVQSASGGYAINVYKCSRVTFDGNFFKSCGNPAGPGGGGAINFAQTGTSAYVKFVNNTFTDPAGVMVRAIYKEAGHTFTPATNVFVNNAITTSATSNFEVSPTIPVSGGNEFSNIGVGTPPVSYPFEVDAGAQNAAGFKSNAGTIQITATDGTVTQAVGYANTTFGYVGTISAHNFGILVGNAPKIEISTNSNVLINSGNLAFGTGPSAWNSASKAIQLSTYASLATDSTNRPILTYNSYVDSGGSYRYVANGSSMRMRFNPTDSRIDWGFAASGTADNTFSYTTQLLLDDGGRMALTSLATTDAWAKMRVGGTLPSSTNLSVAYDARFTVPSSTTSAAVGYQSFASTQAASFTLTTLKHYNAEQGTVGAGSAVTTQVGYFADSTLTGATNNYGFYGDIASGSNRFNCYMGGTATNYFNGSVGIGTASPSEKLEVNGALKTAAPSGGTAAAWKLGTVATVSPTSPNRTIEVEIGGTTYYIHAKTTNN